MKPPFLGMTSPFKSHGWSLFVKVKSHVTALNPIKTHCITWNHIKSHWIPCNHINYHWIPLNLPLSYHTHVMSWPGAALDAASLPELLGASCLSRECRRAQCGAEEGTSAPGSPGAVKDQRGLSRRCSENGRHLVETWCFNVFDVFLLGISARKLVLEWDIHGIDMGYWWDVG